MKRLSDEEIIKLYTHGKWKPTKEEATLYLISARFVVKAAEDNQRKQFLTWLEKHGTKAQVELFNKETIIP